MDNPVDIYHPSGDSGLVKKPWISSRYAFILLSFFGFFNAYALRINLSLAIVAMVNNTFIPDDNSTSSNVCLAGNSSTSSNSPIKNGTFDWDANTQGIILGSFFYGYICTQIFGGWISQKYGAKHPFGFAVLISGALSLLIPVAAKWHYQALIAVRVLQGLFQGVIFPAMHTMMGQWAPPLERSHMASISFSGVEFGTVGSLILSGLLSDHLGWESVFYFFGGTSIFWYIFWLFLAFDSPNKHPRISDEERLFITHALGNGKATAESSRLPWTKLIKSLPVWALIIGNFGHNWGFYTLITNIPTYLSQILHFSLETNGFLSALPYLVMAAVMQISGYFADWLITKKILSTTWVRRLFHLSGQLLPAICLVALGYVGCDLYAAISLLTLSVGLDGLATSGFQVNHVDLSPTHAGLLMGISNTFGTIPGMLGPFVVGQLTSGPLGETISQWRLVFFISAGVYVATAIFFAIFASGQLASWERPRLADWDDDNEDEKLITDHQS